MNDDHNHASPEDALKAMELIAAFIPPCPRCNAHCMEWVHTYILRAIQAFHDPIGPIAFFVAICRKFANEDGEITINGAELDRSNEGTAIKVTKETGLEIFHIKVITGDETIETDPNRETIDWPDLIG